MGRRRSYLLFVLLPLYLTASEASAKEKLSVALNVDPSHLAMTYALRTGKVTSDVVDIDLHFLDINALTQAVSTKRFDILQLSALAVPRAVKQGLAMKILGNTASVRCLFTCNRSSDVGPYCAMEEVRIQRGREWR